MVQVSKRPAAPSARSARCCEGLASLLSPKLFKALGDSRRLSLLLRLAGASGPCTVSDIAGGSGVDLSVVSRHLAVLRDAGVIRCVKRGKEVWCSLEPSAVVRLLRGLADELERCCPAGVCASEPASPGPSSSPRPAPSRRSR